MKAFLSPLLALCLVSSTLSAATYIVDGGSKSASDDNSGAPDKPFLTINAAAKRAKPGDTILIRSGTYRETVEIPLSGEPGKPITCAADKGQHVVITGADRVTGWKKCAKQDVAGNPNFANIFVADLDWLPPKLYEGSHALIMARTPKEGWWGIKEGFDLTSFSDPEHLTQTDPHAWDGWTVAILEQAGGEIVPIEVASFDPQAHKITMARPYSKYRKKIDATRDRYYMCNHLSALSGPGQYVLQKQGKGCRIYAWPARLDANGQPNIEAVRRGNQAGVINFVGKSNIIFDGLDVCFSANSGFNSNGGSVAPNNIVIQNCVIHDNEGYGVLIARGEKNTVRRCNIRYNSNGIVAYECSDLLIEENDIGPSHVDGIDIANHVHNARIVRNFLHDNNRWGHPDNLQFWGDVEGTFIDSNVFLNGGQGIMSDEMVDTHVLNNLFVGSYAVLLIASGDDWDIQDNTIVAGPGSPTNFCGSRGSAGGKLLTGKGFKLKGNIIAPLHVVPAFTVLPESSSDYDLIWNGGAADHPVIIGPKWSTSAMTIDEVHDKYNSEQHGLIADPLFESAPKFFTCTDYARTAACTAGKLWLQKSDAAIPVGNTIEVNFDGVPRKVTDSGVDFVAFAPPLPAPPDTILPVADWGTQTSVKWDLRLAPKSPARKANEGGKDIGSSLNLENYLKGDFNNSGQCLVPTLPTRE